MPLSDYIRTVYRISEEGAVEGDDQRKQVLQTHPELSQLATCVAADTTNADCRTRLAEAYVQLGLPWSAYTLFNEVLKFNGDDFRSTLGLARIWDQWKDYVMARRLAETAIAINPAARQCRKSWVCNSHRARAIMPCGNAFVWTSLTR